MQSVSVALKRIVDKILAAKQRDAGADTRALEREIDESVYALYGLTPEEIRLVEASGKSWESTLSRELEGAKVAAKKVLTDGDS
jgi:hypothetical protein